MLFCRCTVLGPQLPDFLTSSQLNSVQIRVTSLLVSKSYFFCVNMAKASVVQGRFFKLCSTRPEEKCYHRPAYGIARMLRNDVSVQSLYVWKEPMASMWDWTETLELAARLTVFIRNILAFSQVVFSKRSCVSLLNAVMALDDSSTVRPARWMILKSHLYKRQGWNSCCKIVS